MQRSTKAAGPCPAWPRPTLPNPDCLAIDAMTARPCRAERKTCKASPNRAQPRTAEPNRTATAIPCSAEPCQVRPTIPFHGCHAIQFEPDKAETGHTNHCRAKTASPYLPLPCRTIPRLTSLRLAMTATTRHTHHAETAKPSPAVPSHMLPRLTMAASPHQSRIRLTQPSIHGCPTK